LSSPQLRQDRSRVGAQKETSASGATYAPSAKDRFLALTAPS
jgi:hypothetical protein